MGMQSCPDCGRWISTIADTCPVCGRPMGEVSAVEVRVRPKNSRGTMLAFWVLMGIVSFPLIYGIPLIGVPLAAASIVMSIATFAEIILKRR